MADPLTDEDKFALLVAQSQSPFQSYERQSSPYIVPKAKRPTAIERGDQRLRKALSEPEPPMAYGPPDSGLDELVYPDITSGQIAAKATESNPIRTGLQWLRSWLPHAEENPNRQSFDEAMVNPKPVGLGERLSYAPGRALNLAVGIPDVLAHGGEHYAGWRGHGLGEFDPVAMLVPPNPGMFLPRGWVARQELKPSTWDSIKAAVKETPALNWEENSALGGWRTPGANELDPPAIWPGEDGLGGVLPHQANPFSPVGRLIQKRLEEIGSEAQWPRPPKGFDPEQAYGQYGNLRKGFDPEKMKAAAGNDAEIGLVKPPVGHSLRFPEKTLEAKAGVKAIPALLGRLFDTSSKTLEKVPNVPQVDFPEPAWARGPPERVLDQRLGGKRNMDRLRLERDAGAAMGGRGWYNNQQLLERFQGEFGKREGGKRFHEFMDYVSATSPQSKVGENIRNASYRYSRAMQGELAPEKGFKPESPYGHYAQQLHNQNVKNVMEGGLDPLANPKPFRFAENLTGNYEPVTVDSHATRAVGFKDTMGRGVDEPGPAYSYLADIYRQLATEKGMRPAQAQSSVWLGAADRTGMVGPKDPFLKVFEDRIKYTADKRGLKPEEVLRRMMRGEEPLLGKAGDSRLASLMAALPEHMRKVPEGAKAMPPLPTAPRVGNEALPLTQRVSDWLRQATGKQPHVKVGAGADKTDYVNVPDRFVRRPLAEPGQYENRSLQVRVPSDQHTGAPKVGTLDTATGKTGERKDYYATNGLNRYNAYGEPFSNIDNLIEGLKWATSSAPPGPGGKWIGKEGNWLVEGAEPAYGEIPRGKQPRWAKYQRDVPPADIPETVSPNQPRLSSTVGELWAKGGDQRTAPFFASGDARMRAATDEALQRVGEGKVKQWVKALEGVPETVKAEFSRKNGIEPSYPWWRDPRWSRVMRSDAGESKPGTSPEIQAQRERARADKAATFWEAYDRHAGNREAIADELGMTSTRVSQLKYTLKRPVAQSAEARAAEEARMRAIITERGQKAGEANTRMAQERQALADRKAAVAARRAEGAAKAREMRTEEEKRMGHRFDSEQASAAAKARWNEGKGKRTLVPKDPAYRREQMSQEMRIREELAKRGGQPFWDEKGRQAARSDDLEAAQRIVDQIKKGQNGGGEGGSTLFTKSKWTPALMHDVRKVKEKGISLEETARVLGVSPGALRVAGLRADPPIYWGGGAGNPGGPRQWTPERYQDVRQHVEAGKSRAEIADIMGVTEQALKKAAERSDEPVKFADERKRWPSERLQQVRDHLKAGKSKKEVADLMGVTEEALRKVAERADPPIKFPHGLTGRTELLEHFGNKRIVFTKKGGD